MANFKIEGKTRLSGKIQISGAKNEALKLIPFSSNLSKPIIIDNVPDIEDVRKQIDIYTAIGGKGKLSQNQLILDPTDIDSSNINFKKSRQLRASILFLGALLARFGRVSFPFPGGCAIGARPIDTHLNAFRDLGAQIINENGGITVKLDQVTSNKVSLDERSVSATENIIIYLASTENDVTVSNCAIEPEIIHLIEIINSAGAKIKKVSDRSFRVKGKKDLELKRAEVMPDRIEAGSFVIALVASGGEGTVSPFIPSHNQCLIDVLTESGANLEIDSVNNVCKVLPRDGYLKPFQISTAPFPGFPTDLQSPMSLIASSASGVSMIEEKMFENRLKYLEQLRKMGLKYEIEGNTAKIIGPCQLQATSISSLDLRSGITLLLASTQAEGTSIIEDAEIIDRGYEAIEKKLSMLGAKIERTNV